MSRGTTHVKGGSMRTTIALAVAAALATFVTGCASTSTPYGAAHDVPMYSASEWTAMNSESSLPEISDSANAAEGQSEGAVASSAGSSFGGFGFDNGSFGSSFRSRGGGSAVHGAIGSVSGHMSMGSGGHASGGGHSGGHGGGHGGH
jgi:hypothetical protein